MKVIQELKMMPTTSEQQQQLQVSRQKRKPEVSTAAAHTYT